MAKLTIPQEWLNQKIKIALIGCGGTGSEMLDEIFKIHSLLIALGGNGFSVTAYDPDTVSIANIGRQRFWSCDIGYNKAEVQITRTNSFGNTDWNYVNQKFVLDDTDDFDILITCVDSPEVRADIGKKALEINSGVKNKRFHSDPSPTFWMDCGNDAFKGNVIFGHFNQANAALKIPNVFDLYPVLSTMKVNEEPSCSTLAALEKQDYGINRSVAREAGNILWQFLRHGSLNHHGSYIDIKAGTVSPLPIDENIWKTFN